MIGSERFVFGFSLVMIVVFITGIMISSKGIGIEVPECVPVEKTYTKGKVEQLDNHTYRVYYVAGMWQFEPATVEIPLESDMDIFLTSKDVVHGFFINKKDVNLMAVPGTINVTRVKFHKRGEYSIVCHEYCGVGHQNMEAKIIVN